MGEDKEYIGWHRISGSHRETGRRLGVAGRAAVHRLLVRSEFWKRMTSALHAPRVARMAEATRARFPGIWEEIEGLAEGLDLPAGQVMAWNCRGDLLASAPDGCTTVMVPGQAPVIAHNEDGLPFFRGACFIADVRPQHGPGFWSFCYPGSIPGHSFALTDAGLVQTVNNIRLTGIEAEIPRMVLGRAVLSAESPGSAIGILRSAPPSGGFHFALACTGRREIHSVEFGGGHCDARIVADPEIHANHALRLAGGGIAQVVTGSSRDRQTRGVALLRQGVGDPLAILRDTGGDGLPIRRDAPDDPDEENTLATVVFRVGDTETGWEIHGGGGQILSGRGARRQD